MMLVAHVGPAAQSIDISRSQNVIRKYHNILTFPLIKLQRKDNLGFSRTLGTMLVDFPVVLFMVFCSQVFFLHWFNWIPQTKGYA